jgi:hypothetical protein
LGFSTSALSWLTLAMLKPEPSFISSYSTGDLFASSASRFFLIFFKFRLSSCLHTGKFDSQLNEGSDVKGWIG